MEVIITSLVSEATDGTIQITLQMMMGWVLVPDGSLIIMRLFQMVVLVMDGVVPSCSWTSQILPLILFGGYNSINNILLSNSFFILSKI